MSQGALGGLAILCKLDTIEINLISSSPQWILSLIISRVSEVKFCLFNVYGPTMISKKKKLWKELSHVLYALNDQLVIFGGDFNAILDEVEKMGGVIPNKKGMEEFNTFIQTNNLFDCQPNNGKIT